MGFLETSNRYGFNLASYVNNCHVHIIIWMEFRGAPHPYEVVSALILCLIKTIELFGFLFEFLQCLSKISEYWQLIWWMSGNYCAYVSFLVPFLTEKKLSLWKSSHTGITFNVLLVLNCQGDSSSFPLYRCQICTSCKSVLVDITVQKEWASLHVPSIPNAE